MVKIISSKILRQAEIRHMGCHLFQHVEWNKQQIFYNRLDKYENNILLSYIVFSGSKASCLIKLTVVLCIQSDTHNSLLRLRISAVVYKKKIFFCRLFFRSLLAKHIDSKSNYNEKLFIESILLLKFFTLFFLKLTQLCWSGWPIMD